MTTTTTTKKRRSCVWMTVMTLITVVAASCVMLLIHGTPVTDAFVFSKIATTVFVVSTTTAAIASVKTVVVDAAVTEPVAADNATEYIALAESLKKTAADEDEEQTIAGGAGAATTKTVEATATAETTTVAAATSNSISNNAIHYTYPLEKPDYYFESSTDPDIKLACRQWMPQQQQNNKIGKSSNIKRIVLAHHSENGIHSGLFDPLAKGLTTTTDDDGILFLAYDMVGTGFSNSLLVPVAEYHVDTVAAASTSTSDKTATAAATAPPPPPQQMQPRRYWFDSMDTLANDFAKVIDDTKKKYPGIPVFAMGEGLGALVLLYSLVRDDDDAATTTTTTLPMSADGYIFTGTPIQIRKEMAPPSLLFYVLKWLARLIPDWKIPGIDSKQGFEAAFGGDTSWATTLLEHDPFVQQYLGSPVRLGPQVSYLQAAETVATRLSKVSTVPFLVLVGSNDTRVYPHDSEAMYNIAAAAAAASSETNNHDKTIHVIPNGSHMLFLDRPEITNQAIQLVRDWIIQRTTTSPSVTKPTEENDDSEEKEDTATTDDAKQSDETTNENDGGDEL